VRETSVVDLPSNRITAIVQRASRIGDLKKKSLAMGNF
jgi:hypothetical protein